MRQDSTTLRVFIPTSEITEGDRVRKDYGDVAELAESINTEGLIQPVVIDLNKRLVAGGRRLRAIRDILKWPETPCVFIEVLDDAQLRRLEAEENIRRKDMTWQEKVQSIKTVHNYQTLNASLKSERWTQSMTGSLINFSQAHVAYALIIARCLDSGDDVINKCATFTDAIRILVKRKEDEVTATIAKATIPGGGTSQTRTEDITAILSQQVGQDSKDGFFATEVTKEIGVGVAGRPTGLELPSSIKAEEITVPLSNMLFKGDSITWMKSQPAESVDHIITDPPYGIDMAMLDHQNPHGGMKDISSVTAEHDIADNESLHSAMLPEMFRLLRPSGFCILWADMMQWQRQYDLAIAAGFKVQRWPLIWSKTHQCMNQMAQYNFTKNYEIAIVCRKGNATLLSPQSSSIWQGSGGSEKDTFGHPFAKPANLWKWLYAACCQRGQRVLDPFAGSGSATVAALAVGLSPVAVEVNEAHYNRLVLNVSNAYHGMYPNIRFV